MSSFNGEYVMMPVKVIGKDCETCVNFAVEVEKDELMGSDGIRFCEMNMRCVNLVKCLRVYKAMQKWEKGTPVPYEMEGGGSNWYPVCGECHGVISDQDSFCRHCGTPVKQNVK